MIKEKNGDSFQYEQQSYSEIKWKRRRRTKRIKGWREGERIQATGRHCSPESCIKLAETLLLIAPRITCMALVM
ncbi:unnamed protein product [Musa hybrid cultivar]